jgi:hypothetical protein
MNGRWGRIVAALAVVALGAEESAAGEPGFYVGVTGSRVEYDLDTSPVLAIATFVSPPLPGLWPRPLPPGIIGVIGFPVALVGAADRVEIDDVDAGWSATLGYRVNRYFAAEVTYADFGEAAFTERFHFMGIPELPPLPDLVRSTNVSLRGPSFSVLGSLPLGERWELFLRGAVLFADQEVKTRIDSSNITGPALIEAQFSDEVAMAGAGVQWSFAPRWTARLEYQRTDDLEQGFRAENRIDAASLSVLFGL